jgi:Methionyl-tRNA formyltransferase
MQLSLYFLGSKSIGYHCLRILIELRDKLNLDIKGILTNDRQLFDSTVSIRQLAAEHQIPILDSPDAMQDVDFICSVQYHQILHASHIAKARQLAFNLHMAPLPEYRGCNQFTFALLDEKKQFGTTIHRMDTRIDHGDILAEKRFDIPPDCWVQTLYQLTYDASIQLFEERIADLLTGNYTPIPQQVLEAERGWSLHYRHEILQAKIIDLNWDATRIQKHIRATAMPGFEPPYALIGNKKIYFCEQWQHPPSPAPSPTT